MASAARRRARPIIAAGTVAGGGYDAPPCPASCSCLAALRPARPAVVRRRPPRCSVKGKERKLGATYVTKVTASGISCGGALDVVKAYHRCRRARGGADGRCPRVSGYRCSEKRTSSPTQYDSRATCRKGSRRVVQQYTQNT